MAVIYKVLEGLIGLKLSILVCFIYILFTGIQASTVRAFIMIFILFGKKDLFFYLKALVIYMLYSMLLAGLCIFLEFNKNPYGNFSGAIYNFSYKKLMLSLIILYLLINRLIVYIKDRKNVEMLIFIVGIITKNKEKKVSAFLDTGNELREPITNLPCILIEEKLISSVSFNDENTYHVLYSSIGYGGELKGIRVNNIQMKNREVDGKIPIC
jgi:stage II sporulation protein GA (sporulation sigma-E factor processing peptidase)